MNCIIPNYVVPIFRRMFRKNHSSFDNINFGHRSIRKQKKNERKKTGHLPLAYTEIHRRGTKGKKRKKNEATHKSPGKWKINRDRSCSLRLLQSWNARGLGNYARGRNIRPDSRNFAGKLKGGRSMFTNERRAIVRECSPYRRRLKRTLRRENSLVNQFIRWRAACGRHCFLIKIRGTGLILTIRDTPWPMHV